MAYTLPNDHHLDGHEHDLLTLHLVSRLVLLKGRNGGMTLITFRYAHDLVLHHEREEGVERVPKQLKDALVEEPQVLLGLRQLRHEQQQPPHVLHGVVVLNNKSINFVAYIPLNQHTEGVQSTTTR